jgi:PAS domain S-box-containing protein
MNSALPGQHNYQDAFFKAAQYLAGLTQQQDVWAEAGKVMLNFFGADICAFGERDAEGKIIIQSWTPKEQSFEQRDMATEVVEAVADVLESGFLSVRVIAGPAPVSMVFLPVVQENRNIAVMLAGHRTPERLPHELLNVYLAVTGLVGTTATRLSSERELRKYRRHLEKLVEERTTELTVANTQLQQEITERKRFEKALKQERDKLTSIFETMEDGIYIADSEYRILYSNSALVKDFGPSDGRKCYECIHDYSEPCAWCHMQDVLEGKATHWEHHFLRNTKTFDIIETPLQLENETVKLTIFRDITYRKQAEQELERETAFKGFLNLFYQKAMTMTERELYDLVLEESVRLSESTIGFLHFISDDQQNAIMTTWTRKAFEYCTVPYNTLAQAGNWANCIRLGKPVIYNDFTSAQNQKELPEGHTIVKRIMSVPVVEADNVKLIFGVGNKTTEYDERDLARIQLVANELQKIIEYRRAQEALRILNEGLEQIVLRKTQELVDAQEELVRKEKLSILGQLSGSVGHELRNPLGVMSNAVYYLQAVLPDADNTVKEYLDIIKYEIDNSLRIITDLLGFARTKTPQTTDIFTGQLLKGSLAKCAIPENVSVLMDIPENLPLCVDPQQMEQVLINLITNGIQAMPDGGEIYIGARHAHGTENMERGAGIISDLRSPILDPGFIEISVTDTGVGISEENMKKLFQPLFTTKAKGIGLGLVVCKNLTEANGGRIEVASHLDKGTTFTVILPASPEE